MVRTQIQLPDAIHARAKEVCRARELSMAELARRGIEYMLEVYGPVKDSYVGWQPPTPRHLGWHGMTDDELKEQAQFSSAELQFRGEPSD